MCKNIYLFIIIVSLIQNNEQKITNKLLSINFFKKDLLFYNLQNLNFKLNEFNFDGIKVYLSVNIRMNPKISKSLINCKKEDISYGYIVKNGKCSSLFDNEEKYNLEFIENKDKKKGIKIYQNNLKYILNFNCSNKENEGIFKIENNNLIFNNQYYCGKELNFIKYFSKYDKYLKAIFISFGLIFLIFGGIKARKISAVIGFITGILIVSIIFLIFFNEKSDDNKFIMYIIISVFIGFILSIFFYKSKYIIIILLSVIVGYLLSIFVYNFTINIVQIKYYYEILLISFILFFILVSLVCYDFILIIKTSIIGSFIISYFSLNLFNLDCWTIFIDFLEEINNLNNKLFFCSISLILFIIGVFIQFYLKNRQDKDEKGAKATQQFI